MAWTQSPIEGVSFAHTFNDSEGQEPPRETQYYEMFGYRAIYHDGWKAVVFHPMMGFAYDGVSDPRLPFDDDPWELYHVAEDFSESTDLAAQEPERLQMMIDLWWSEAERNQVLPLTNQPGRHADQRWRRSAVRVHAGHRSAARRRRAEPAQPRLHRHRVVQPSAATA